jgi:hypothetical protein
MNGPQQAAKEAPPQGQAVVMVGIASGKGGSNYPR